MFSLSGLESSPFGNLPVEVRQEIFGYLDGQDLKYCAEVCRTFRDETRDNKLWKPIVEQYFPSEDTSKITSYWDFIKRKYMKGRTYTFSENPFMYGLTGRPYDFTDNMCGLSQSKCVEDFIFHTLSYRKDRKYLPLTQKEKIAYFSGRAIFVLKNIPGALVDIALQIAECFFLTIEFPLAKIESKVRFTDGQNQLMSNLGIESFSHNLFIFRFGPEAFIRICQEILTAKSFHSVAYGLGFVDWLNPIPSISSIYKNALSKLW